MKFFNNVIMKMALVCVFVSSVSQGAMEVVGAMKAVADVEALTPMRSVALDAAATRCECVGDAAVVAGQKNNFSAGDLSSIRKVLCDLAVARLLVKTWLNGESPEQSGEIKGEALPRPGKRKRSSDNELVHTLLQVISGSGCSVNQFLEAQGSAVDVKVAFPDECGIVCTLIARPDNAVQDEKMESAAAGFEGKIDESVKVFGGAVDRADVHTVQSMLLGDPTLAYRHSTEGVFPLMRASIRGRTNVARMLLDAGANVDEGCKKDGATPLLAVCSEGYLDTASLLLERKASVNLKSTEGFFPLWSAYQARSVELRPLLLNASADVNQRLNSGQTVLMRACRDGDGAAARELVVAGADVNALAESGRTPLKTAIVSGNVVLVNLLLEAKAEPNKTRVGGDTPLIHAVIGESREIVRALLQAKADPRIQNDHQCNALYYASHPEIHEMLQAAQRVAAVQDVGENKKEERA